MYNLQAVTDVISRGADLYRHYVPAEWNSYPNAAAVMAVVLGITLAFWGARLLRTMYVLAFLAAGAAVGFKVGRYLAIDPLIGLTLGGGISAFVGFFFYRWWVATTAGLFALFLVLGVAWPRILEVAQEYTDRRDGVGTAQYVLGQHEELQSLAVQGAGFGRYLMTDRRDFGVRLAFAGGTAWLLGMVAGLLLPRFTTVLGTSLLGVLLLGTGVGVVLWRNFPGAWSRVANHPDWYLVAGVATLIAAAWMQVRPRRIRNARETAAAGPAPAPAPAAK